MPLVCTKDQDKFYKTITTKLLSKKTEDKPFSETLKTFSPVKSDTSVNTNFLTGTSIQNSTVKLNLLKIRETNHSDSDEVEKSYTGNTLPVINEIRLDQDKNETLFEEAYDKSSIISGSKKLQELKKLHKQLRKSPNDPKPPLFEPRRPTIEAIKEAIEKAKKLEMNRHKNVGTDDEESASTSVLQSDASTSTGKSRKKNKKKLKTKSQAKKTNTDSKRISLKPKRKKNAS